MRMIIISFFIWCIYLTKVQSLEIGEMDINEPKDLGLGVQMPMIRNTGPFDNSEGLHEFTPIRATIGQSETQYYSFGVNTSTGIGEVYEFLIFLTGNICSQPNNTQLGDPSLAVYYSFNSSMFQNMELGQMSLFKDGYFQALADVPIQSKTESKDSILYIAVRAPENTDKSSSWLYEIGVSQNDLVFQWDDRSWANLVDTDDNSALIVTGNLTDDGSNLDNFNVSRSRYSLYIYSEEYKNYFDQLNSSWCAVRSGPTLLAPDKIQSNFTTRSGGLQQQFYVTGLNSSTKYIAYLLSDFAGTNFGGAIYQPFQFETMNENSCNLIYDLNFCNKVAYSVPNNPDFTKEQLLELYDNRAESLYQNFSKALQQVACNTTKDSIFSPIRSCEDCAESYKDWLCAITIPRCSTRNITGYLERDVGENRNEWINDVIKPFEKYYEVLPCFNVCEAIVRDCPSSFGFVCPKHNNSICLSYYWEDSSDYPTCNYVGKVLEDFTSGAIKLVFNWALVFVVLLHFI